MVHFCKSPKCLVGKVAIITGANTGIGYYTALDFAKRGCRVILACRNQEKANQARNNIVAATGNDNVVVKLLDLESLESVRQFAFSINATETRLDLLVNNAGAANLPDSMTADGLQLEMAVNYFGHFLLTNLLLDLLKASAPSRIINVSSIGARVFGELNTEQLNKHDGDVMLYCKTKLCNIYFTQELAERLGGTAVTTYSVHPGAVHTDFQRFSSVLNFVASKFFLTSEEGAQTTICVALEDVEQHNGQHFEDCKPVKPYANARNENIRKKLWAITKKMVRFEE